MSDQKRYVVLTGAGAAIPFNGPRTCDITCEIVGDSLFKVSDGRTLGKYLVDRIEKKMDTDRANFEALIEIVEELKFRSRDRNDEMGGEARFPSSMVYDIEKKFRRDALQLEAIYDRREGGYYSNGHQIIPDSDIDAHWYFLDQVIGRWMRDIIDCIECYATSCASHDLAEKYCYFLRDLREHGTLRHYTLNYDRLVPEISSDEVFDGFGELREGSDGAAYRIRKPNRIRFDDDVDCAYNLHGSIFFRRRSCTETPEINSRRDRWVCTPGNVNDFPTTSGESDSSRRRETMPITTGLQKPGRMLTRPNLPFYQRFGMDCASADVFIIIGYSFGDPHVNELIQERVEPGEAEVWYVGHSQELREESWLNMRQFFNDNRTPELPETWGPSRPRSRISDSLDQSGSWFQNERDLYSIYFNGFGEFLRQEDWRQPL